MKDKLIEGYLRDFVESHGLGEIEQTKAFEHFVNHCIISREHPENFDFESVSVGGTGDMAIDGIAILVNEHLVASKEEVDYFKRSLRRLEVRFVFIQSKTSDKFETGSIGNFFYGVRTFFGQQPPGSMNAQLRTLRELKEYVYAATIDMDRAPTCELYYVTCGKWVDDAALTERVAAGKTELDATGLFSEVKFSPLGAESIKTLYRELRRKVVREIAFDKHTILPRIDHVREAYIGILPCEEYLKLLCDSEGTLQRSLFYDNVRDFQGNNAVNLEMQATLTEQDNRDKFVLLNNGVTIVAQSINKVGSTFKLVDFQIVNGCQTSHILYRNRDRLGGAFLPVKIIVTDDGDVTNAITKGTNRQTEVKIEAFESLNPFQKDLEEFYSTFGKHRVPRLYYERRSKQYENLPSINPRHVVSLPAQVKCFVGMFLNEPHSTHRYYGELLEANRNRMFLVNHALLPYYVSGYALVLVERLFANGILRHNGKHFKDHLLMVTRIIASEKAMPYLNDKKRMDEYCSFLLQALSDDANAKKVFKAAQDVLEGALNETKCDKQEAHRLRAFTAELVSVASKGKDAGIAKVKKVGGTVRWFSGVRGYGFIASHEGDLFVHARDIICAEDRMVAGADVEFTMIQSTKGLQAVAVEVVAKTGA